MYTSRVTIPQSCIHENMFHQLLMTILTNLHCQLIIEEMSKQIKLTYKIVKIIYYYYTITYCDADIILRSILVKLFRLHVVAAMTAFNKIIKNLLHCKHSENNRIAL